MLVSKRQDREATFVLEPDDLERLDEILAAFGKPRLYTVSLKDGFVLEVSGREDLLRDLDREHAAEVVDLLATTPWEADQRATVRLLCRDAEDKPHVEYDLAGPPELMFRQSIKLDRWLAGIRPWYSWVATTGLVGFISFGCGLAAFIMIANLFPSRGKPGSPFNPWTIPALLGTGSAWLQKRVFPGGYFALSVDARRTYGRIKSEQWLLLVGVILATATSLLANALSGR